MDDETTGRPMAEMARDLREPRAEREPGWSLYELHTRLSGEPDLHVALGEILAAACDFAGTRRGCVELVGEEDERLELVVWQGYPADSPFLGYLRRETPGSLFDMARRRDRRALIDDVATSPTLAGTRLREAALAAGVHSMQTTSLVSRRGETVGVLSVQFHEPHQPSDDELRLLDLLSWTAAEFVTRHRAEEQLRRAAELDSFRLQLSDALRTLSDPVEIQATASRLLAEITGADRAFYGEITGDGQEVVVERDHAPGVASVAGRYRISDFGRAEVARIRTGTTVVASNVAADPTLTDAERSAYTAIDVGAHVDVPLIKDGRFAAFVAVQQVKPRSWTPVEVQLIEEVAERTWAAVERARAEDALRRSEQRYRTLFESIDEGFCIIELIFDENDRAVDWRYVEANASFASQTGFADVVGRTLRALTPEIEWHWLEFYGRIAKTGESKRLTSESKALGRWYDLFAFRVGEPREHRVGVLFNDVTERKRGEANLELLAEISDALVHLTDIEETMNALGARIGEHFRASLCSFSEIDESRGTFALPFAWHREGVPSVIGEHRISDYYTEDFVQASREGITGVVCDTFNDARANAANMASVHIRSLITVPLVRDNEWRFSLTIADTHPRDWRNDEVQLVRELATRIWTSLERARAEDALRKSEERLREAGQRKDEFLAVLAHELRNPLAPIRTGLELIRVAADSPEAVETVRVMMDRQVSHMVRLIDDLLDVSRITTGKIRLQREPTSVASLLSRAIEGTRDAITAKEITLSLHLPDSLCVVDVDPTRFVQVLSNLLHNSAKFTDKGGAIRVSAAVDDQDPAGLIVSVADSGIGISESMLPRVFDLFTQADRSSSQPGLGIGLALARRLVEMHGGRIEARSEGLGRGSEFLIHLPVSTQAPPVQAAEPMVPIVPHRNVHCRVMVIDDNRDAARVMAMLVETLGGECRTAYDGESGLRAILEYRPDVVLLDIGMPKMDGYETCRRIRGTLGAGVVVVAVTGFGQDRDKDRATQAGFDAHLTKPADPAAVERILFQCGTAGPE